MDQSPTGSLGGLGTREELAQSRLAAMNIKGSLLVARRQAIVQEHGQAVWDELLAELAAQSAFFAQVVTPATEVPVAEYVRFQRALLDRFHGGDERAWWDGANAAARWALTEGPYRTLIEPGDLDGALQLVMPRLWRLLTDKGTIRGRRDGRLVTVEIIDVDYWDLALEYGTMGYAQAVLELVSGGPVEAECIVGVKQGVGGCRYLFRLAPPANAQ